MANHDNARRGEKKRTEHGSRWENGENDRNSSRARAKWKKRKHRSLRRNGVVTKKFRAFKPGKLKPNPAVEEE